jgi:hypothetical protein
MRVFISWSGDTSKKVAELLKLWLPSIINDIDPWVSTKDIPGGAQWFTEINNQLMNQNVGIAILTPENLDSPWIHYECGALAKGLTEARVYYLCVGVQPTDVKPPLGHLNGTVPDKDGMRKFIGDLNTMLEKPRGTAALDFTFGMVWDHFETKFNEIISAIGGGTNSAGRGIEDMISEVLNTVRSLEKRFSESEKLSSSHSTFVRDENAHGFAYHKDPLSGKVTSVPMSNRSTADVYRSLRAKDFSFTLHAFAKQDFQNQLVPEALRLLMLDEVTRDLIFATYNDGHVSMTMPERIFTLHMDKIKEVLEENGWTPAAGGPAVTL